MKPFQRFSKKFPIKVGVDLCCGDAFMAKHFLYGTQVCTTFYQMCSKGMTKSVG